MYSQEQLMQKIEQLKRHVAEKEYEQAKTALNFCQTAIQSLQIDQQKNKESREKTTAMTTSQKLSKANPKEEKDEFKKLPSDLFAQLSVADTKITEEHQKECKDFIATISSKIGIQLSELKSYDTTSDDFQKRLAIIVDRWYGAHSVLLGENGKRIAEGILVRHLSEPIFLAIIADNDRYFQTVAPKKRSDLPEHCLEFACLCGATKIVTLLLTSYNYDLQGKYALDLVAYAASSKNEELTLMLTAKVASAGIKGLNTNLLYSYGEYQLARKVEQQLLAENTGEQPKSQPTM